MNIPHATIEPFEPLGIPVLTLIVEESDMIRTIYDNLESTYKLITDLELDDGSSWARETLEGCAMESGARKATCMDQPLRDSDRIGYMMYIDADDGTGERKYLKLLHPKP